MAPGVRVIYVVPEGSEPWGEAERRAAEVLEDIQWFFADEMNRLGHGLQTFDSATDADGSFLFHQIDSPLSKEHFIHASRRQYPARCRSAAKSNGLCNNNNVTVYFVEAYSIINGKVRGAQALGWSRNGGEAFLSSLHLKMARREWISNENGYDGKVFDWIDSQPMKRGTLNWNKRGTQLGDVSGSGFGIIAHELGHSFALPKQEKMRRGRKGPLMGNGCRGMRGYFRPDDGRPLLASRTRRDGTLS
jgi:hypothetical protein